MNQTGLSKCPGPTNTRAWIWMSLPPALNDWSVNVILKQWNYSDKETLQQGQGLEQQLQQQSDAQGMTDNYTELLSILRHSVGLQETHKLGACKWVHTENMHSLKQLQ